MKVIGMCTFQDENCKVSLGSYDNRRPALRLFDEDDLPMATATINLPEEPLGENQVIIKSYSENAGMDDALMNAGIISAPIKYVQLNYGEVSVHEFLV